MKIRQSKSVQFFPNWGGNDELEAAQKFHIVLRPLERAQFFGIVSELTEIRQDKRADDVTNLTDAEKAELTKAALGMADKLAGMFVRYNLVQNIEKIENLYLNETPVLPAQLLDETIFTGLLVEVIMKLVEISNLSEIDGKN